MSISSITPYTTLAELQALQQPFSLDGGTVTAEPTVTQGEPAAVQSVPVPPPSPLVNAFNQTLQQLGLATAPSAATTSSNTAANATAPDTVQTPANTAQATQNFLGALYQAASTAQAATTASNDSIANNAASVQAASAAAATAAEAQIAYTGTAFNLTTFLQQIESNPSQTVGASTASTQTTESSALATLQANFESLLNTASDVNSQAAAAANSASPTLQTFVQTLAQNIPDQVAPVSPIGPQGNLIQTEV